jgi:hypothetical protein
MRAVIDAVRSSALPLRGVVHAAGVTGFGLLRDTAAETFAGVLRPKVWTLYLLAYWALGLPLGLQSAYTHS